MGVAAPGWDVNPCAASIRFLAKVPPGTYDGPTVLKIFRAIKRRGGRINRDTLLGDDAIVIAAIHEVTGLHLSGLSLMNATKNYLVGLDEARRAIKLDPREEDPGYTRERIVRILTRISEEHGLPLNSRTLAAGFPFIEDIIFEEAGIRSDGKKLLRLLNSSGEKNHLGAAGINGALGAAGFDVREEQRSYLAQKDVRALLRQLDADGVPLNEKTLVQGDPRIDRAVAEYTKAKLDTQELWIAIRDRNRNLAPFQAIKNALVDAGVDTAKHGLGQTREERIAERAQAKADLFEERKQATIEILQAMDDAGVEVTGPNLLAAKELLEKTLAEHGGGFGTAKTFLKWVRDQYPGALTGARTDAGVVREKPPEPPKRQYEYGIEKRHVLEVFKRMHKAGIRVNRTTLKEGSPEIDRIVEEVMGRPVPSHLFINRAARYFATEKGNGFRNAQLAAKLDPEVENFRTNTAKFERVGLTEEQVYARALRALEGKRPIDYTSLLYDETPETTRIIFDATGVITTGRNMVLRVAIGGHGGWYEFLEKKAKVDAEKHRRPQRKWTDENRQLALYWLDFFGQSVSPRGLADNARDPHYRAIIKWATGYDLSPAGILNAANQSPRGLRGDLAAAGVDYRRVYGNDFWSDGDILKALRLLHENGIPLNYTYMRQNPSPRVVKLIESVVGKEFKGSSSGLSLLGAAHVHFKGLDNALWAAEIDPRQERLALYSYKVARDRTISNLIRGGASRATRAHIQKLFEIVEKMEPEMRQRGFLILDTVVSEPLVAGKPEQIAQRVLLETGKEYTPLQVRNFLNRLADHPGFEKWRPE